MTEAWQKREMEQQRLLEGLAMDLVRSTDDMEDENRFFLLLAEKVAKEFALGKNGQVNPREELSVIHSHQELTEKIQQFARTEQERAYLTAGLLLKLLGLGLTPVHNEYLHQKVHKPEKLYEGHQSMDEVELEPAPL